MKPNTVKLYKQSKNQSLRSIVTFQDQVPRKINEWQGSYHVGFHLLGSDAHHQSKQVVTFGALQCGNQLKHGSQMRIQTCI